MDIYSILLIILGVIGSLAFFVFTQRFFSPTKIEESPVSNISDMAQKEVSPFDKIDPSRSFLDKIDYILAKKMGVGKKIERLFLMLGKPDNLDPIKMLHMKEGLAVGLPVFIFLLVGSPVMALFFCPLGFIIPDVLLNSRIQRRQEEILRNFPQFVDLAALMIESGLDYITAFDRIVKVSPVKTELEKEVEKMIGEIQFGYSRRDALRRLADRTGLQEIRSFAGLVIQSDELGTSLVDLLRNFSADMRFRRLNRAEKLAAQASTKMLIPLFIFIFPVVFILMLAPMVSDLLRGGMPF
ncbi:MAG TPA: type II secretion system F family protein [Elusimicrobiales bacterium]|nr:type II secretion system F family protein [Elusimicrobiales bacterium]HOL62012.1 type II secretion system F family protein [Elusimicrobiales bacterium]HPO95116.1 type II secretion system F family protein [Elusimicrobiales bacterium]